GDVPLTFRPMSYKRPHRNEIAEYRFPVRISVWADGTRHDYRNDQTNRWLNAQLGNDGWFAAPATAWGSRRKVNLHLPTIHAAGSLLLACPHVHLAPEAYDGPFPR
ncbi:MAG: hypothetical protein ACU0BS_05745, partial [Hasllibacter sp.]